jgi:hypothetical protein
MLPCDRREVRLASESHPRRTAFMNKGSKRFVVSQVIALMLPFAVACGGGSETLPPPPPPPPAPPAPPALEAPPTAAVDTAPTMPTPPPPVTLLPGAPSPDPPAPLPTVKIAAPTRGQVIPAARAADFQVKLDVKNWQTAEGGPHVHLILDNHPYKAIYDTKAPIKLSELPGGDSLAEGEHVLVAFPSRANHESVKTKDALAVIPFYVGKKAAGAYDPKKPMLVYSRPKGDYNGDAATHVLVDFQLVNATLGEGKNRVDITVTGPGADNGISARVEKFGTPYYLDNLQNGTYSLKLELVGADGNAVPGPWNSTTREIKINHDAPADTSHPTHGPAAHGTGAGPGTGKGPGPGTGGHNRAADAGAPSAADGGAGGSATGDAGAGRADGGAR